MLKTFFSKYKIPTKLHIPVTSFLFKWLFFALLVGVLAGSAAALLLVSLDFVTNIRESNVWLIGFLPLAGLGIGLMYHYLGSSVVKGNNQILEQIQSPTQTIPFRMAPLIFIGTVLTHLFGGSAGREGTAVQMGAAISDQFAKWFRLSSNDKRILLVIGISAGFAGVFGTPLAGAIFALEVVVIGRMRYEAILPAFLAAAIAHFTCHAWGVAHTVYSIPFVPELTPVSLVSAITAGIIFGMVAMLFSKTGHWWTGLFSRFIPYPPLRPFAGGMIIAMAVWMLGTTKYIGLGVPTIQASFDTEMQGYDFLLKLLFTTFTIGAGFKGGEVTPLFFIGATLGNVLVWFLPLPMPLLAGMGFVAVFAGATNTPLACTMMGIELFGAESGLYIGIACVVAYFFSGHTGIYAAQKVGSPKHTAFLKQQGESEAETRSVRS